jgi:small subunit ribosomal protein S5
MKPKEDTQEQTKGVRNRREFDKEAWKPKTEIGKKVKSGEIKDIDEILDKGIRILESEIIDVLIPNIETEFIAIGQSKGKFGGGKKSVWRQTQKKTKEGNRINFSTVVSIGNKDGYIGIGRGKARETVPAREKAIYQAKLNLIKLKRGCGSWECGCGEHHTIPFKVSGKSGSVIVTLSPAPKGTGLSVEEECKKILRLAGIKDVYSKTLGHTATKLNLIQACFKALKQLNKIKVNPEYIKKAGIVAGNKG